MFDVGADTGAGNAGDGVEAGEVLGEHAASTASVRKPIININLFIKQPPLLTSSRGMLCPYSYSHTSLLISHIYFVASSICSKPP